MTTIQDYLNALLTLPEIRGAQVSRDGRWVAWTWRYAAPTFEVFVAPTDGATPPIRLTDTPENTELVSWTPDSRAVIVQQDKSGNERAQLFRVDIDKPLTMIPLTEADPNHYLWGGQLHPNGKWLVYGANFDVTTGAEIEPTYVYRHDLTTGERMILARPQKDIGLPRISPTGDQALYTRMDLHPAGRQIWVVDIDGKNDREVLNFGAEVKTLARWLPDGKRLVVGVETPTHKRLGVLTLATGDIRWLIEDPARNIEGVIAPFNSQQIVVKEVRQARSFCSLLDPDTGQETPFPAAPGNLIPLAPVNSDEWVGLYYSSRQPADIVRFKWSDARPEQLVSLARVWERTTVRPEDLTPAENFTWTAADGLPIQGWLYRPRGTARGTVVYVHGGPSMHSEDKIDAQIQYFVRRGFTVLDPNYRGSTGFGVAFREAIKQDGWGGREQDDIRAGIAALLAAGIAQPGKVGITGTSYGGYSSWCAITRFPSDMLAAAAPICGMTDLAVDYETTRPDLRGLSEEMLGGKPSDVPELYYQRSPIHFVGNIKGRLLIVQGMRDPNVTPENVRVVNDALQKAGVEYELLAFEDEGHGIRKPKNQQVLYTRLGEFFQSAFGG